MNRFGSNLLAIIAAFAVALFGSVALASTAGAQGATDDASEMEAGEAVFASNCAGCHGEDGGGVSGLGRPLTDVGAQADRDQHIAAVVDGKGSMPAFGERLSDDEVSAVVSYVRLGFVTEAAEESMEDADESMEDTGESMAEESMEELAQTGSTTMPLVVVGLVAVASGAMLADRSRRKLRS